MSELRRGVKFKNTLCALLVMALWGSLYPCVKLGYEAFRISTTDIPTIILFAGVRFLICGALLVLISTAETRRFELPTRRELPYILASSLSSIILHYAFTYVALSIGEGSKSAIIKQAGFLFLSCFAFLFDRSERPSVQKTIAGVLGFVGIIATAADGKGITFRLGDALLLLSSVCSAVGTVVAKRGTQVVRPAKFVAYSQLLGGLVMTLAGLILGGRLSYFDLGAFGMLSYICLSSVVAYLIWNILLKTDSISRLSVIKFAEPVFAVLFSGLLLSENVLRWNYLIAGIAVFGAILLSNLHLQARKRNE